MQSVARSDQHANRGDLRDQHLRDGVIILYETIAGALMASYRIYFFGESVIRGRHDFDAENDQNAIQIAHVLFDACSDDCRHIDLWQGTRRVAVPRLFQPKTFDELSAANQECVVDTEERIVHSEWHIAQSRRLLERLASKKGEAGFREAS